MLQKYNNKKTINDEEIIKSLKRIVKFNKNIVSKKCECDVSMLKSKKEFKVFGFECC